jgi:cysteine dioxygenase
MHARTAPLVTVARSPIAQLVRDLRALGDPRRRAVAVDALLGGFGAPLDAIVRRLPFRRGGYARTLVYRDDRFELVVSSWAPGSRAEAHDHDAQDCWFLPLLGAFDLDDFTLVADDGPGARLLPLGARRLGCGELDHRDERQGIHAVTPATPQAVSLHLYARPLDRCRIFDLFHGGWSWRRLRYDAVAPDLGA